MQIEALKEAYEELKKCMAKRILRSDPRYETTPHLHCDFVPLTKRGNLIMKDG